MDEYTKATKLSAEKNKEDGKKDEVANKPKDASFNLPKNPKSEVKPTRKGVSKSPKGTATSLFLSAKLGLWPSFCRKLKSDVFSFFLQS